MTMLSEICHELNNWFPIAKYTGKFIIENGEISSYNDDDMDLRDGQYYRVIGSIFNDGVHKHVADDLIDESFNGAVWAMAIPNEFLLLMNDIEEWQAKYGNIESQAMSPYNSESFGGYSYSKSGGGASDGTSSAGTWQGVFKSRLNKYRRIRGV